MRKRLFNIIEPFDNLTTIEKIYDVFMVYAVVVSLLPLTGRTTTLFYITLDAITTIIFIIDHFLRSITADYKLNQGKLSFIKYPFTFLVITDLVAILSSVLSWNNTLKLLKIIHMVRTIRVFKLFRYLEGLNLLINVLKRQKESLFIVGTLVITYIFISALVILDVEPDIFKNFFDALYWLTISLITVGYGDIYTISKTGRLITMISPILGVAITALLVSIMTAGHLEEIKKEDTESR